MNDSDLKDDWPNFEDYSYQTLLDVYEKIDENLYPDRKVKIAELIKEREQIHDTAPRTEEAAVVVGIVDPKYNTFWLRLIAIFIDGIFFSLLGLIIPPLIAKAPLLIQNAANVISLFDIYIYSVVLHALYGQTIGKFVTGVKVVTHTDETAIGFKQALLRDAVPIALVLLLAVSTSTLHNPVGMENTGASLISFQILIWVSLIWSLLEIATMLTNNKRRALHDLIAGTVVVDISKTND